MRDDRVPAPGRRSATPFVLIGLLVSWLVVQNLTLLVLWSWPVLPSLVGVARALLKAAALVAVQLAPVGLVAAGVALLWSAARRGPAPRASGLEEVRHV